MESAYAAEDADDAYRGGGTFAGRGCHVAVDGGIVAAAAVVFR